MADPKLMKFLRDRIAFVREELHGQGWSEGQITESFGIVAREVAGTPVAPATEPRSPMTVSKAFLFVGGLVIILAGVLYVGLYWSSWSPALRVLAVALPDALLIAAGAMLWDRTGWRRQAVAFLVVGALFTPFVLVVANVQFDILTAFKLETQGFIIAAVLWLLYAGAGFLYRHPAWSVLSSLAGLVTFMFFLSTRGWLDEYWVGWLFLVPAALMLLVGLRHERKGQEEFARGPLMLGSLTLLGALWSLAFGGRLLQPFAGDVANYDPHLRQVLQGWSMVLTAGLAGLCSLGMAALKSEQLQRSAALFRFVAVFGALAGIWSLGLGGSYPLYETLLLVASIGAIFASVPTKSSSFLFGGTLFLVIYIFAIGGEYFQNQVGWPLTLLVAGLLSMGAGLLMERIRRRLKLAA